MAAARPGELSVNGGCMAILIPSLGFARFDTRGELRLAERLKDFLEENAVVWHNLPVGLAVGIRTLSSFTQRTACSCLR